MIKIRATPITKRRTNDEVPASKATTEESTSYTANDIRIESRAARTDRRKNVH